LQHESRGQAHLFRIDPSIPYNPAIPEANWVTIRQGDGFFDAIEDMAVVSNPTPASVAGLDAFGAAILTAILAWRASRRFSSA
jgi:hypothetical protein